MVPFLCSSRCLESLEGKDLKWTVFPDPCIEGNSALAIQSTSFFSGALAAHVGSTFPVTDTATVLRKRSQFHHAGTVHIFWDDLSGLATDGTDGTAGTAGTDGCVCVCVCLSSPCASARGQVLLWLQSWGRLAGVLCSQAVCCWQGTSLLCGGLSFGGLLAGIWPLGDNPSMRKDSKTQHVWGHSHFQRVHPLRES